MPVQTVFESLEADTSVEEITGFFDVTPEEAKAVLHFASQSLAKGPSFSSMKIPAGENSVRQWPSEGDRA
jgi:hypothetical protein